MKSTRVAAQENPPTDIVPLRHPGRLLAAALVLLTAASAAWSVINNPRFQWSVVGEYLFHPAILAGLRMTLVLTASAMTLGIILGVVLASCRMSENKVLSSLAGAYLWFFRGTPLLVQLLFLYNLSALYPRLSLSFFGGPEIVGATTNEVLKLGLVAVIGLTLNESAYMAEIVRGGLLSVPRQQSEAASALGMNRWLSFKRIILPQALRVIVPPTGNQVIGMLKHSSLVSVIGAVDLLYSAQLISSQNFQVIPLLLVASVWYLVATTVLSVLQGRLEARYGRGLNRNDASPRVLPRLRARFSRSGRRPTVVPLPSESPGRT